MEPIGTFSGLASGIQWRDMIDQIMQVENSRRLAPVQNRATLQQKRVAAWASYGTTLGKLNTASKALSDGSAFGQFTVSGGSSATSGRALVTATASASATPGSYSVEVLALARTEKLASATVSDPAAALGVSGEFLVNGKPIDLLATDSLNAVRDKINAANAGTSPSGVSASVLQTAPGSHRLVLVSESSGSAGIDLVDGSSGVLGQLGIVDGTSSANTAADGRAQTHRFSSTTASIATLIGVTALPPPATVTVGGKTISVDLSVDSLSSIAARIQAAGGNAETTTETVDGSTRYRLKADGAVSAGDADGQRALELLGLVERGRGAVAQQLTSTATLTSADPLALGSAATGTTRLIDLRTGGGSDALQQGDTITVRGMRGDGSAAEFTFAVASGSTTDELLAGISQAFSTASRTATATIEGGQIKLVDGTGGDSQLALSFSTNARAGILSLGGMQTTEVGRMREIVAGSDAEVRIDGVTLRRQSNNISDAVQGLTVNLQQAEAGTVVDVTVARDTDASIEAIKSWADAYNGARGFVDGQRNPGAPLGANGTLRSTMRSLTQALFTEVPEVSSSAFSRTALVGVTLSRTGTIEIDETKLRELLASNPADIKTLFAGVEESMSTAVEPITRSGDGTIASQTQSLERSVETLNRRAEDVQLRLDLRREALVRQFTAMEAALSRVQAQGSWLASQIKALQPANS